MPRPAKGPRLYLRKDNDGERRWIIRDVFGDTRTGFHEKDYELAEERFRQYLSGEKGRPAGFIYFITCMSSVHYPIKIGWSSSLTDSRIAALQIGNPNLLTMVATLPGSQEDERRLHLYFGHLHVRGEWFVRDADLIEYIGGLGGPVDCFGAEEFEGRDTSPSTYGNKMPADE